MKTVVIDKFCYRSNAASAQIVRQKIRAGRFGEEPTVFCTVSQYKDSVSERFPEDSQCVTKFGFDFTNVVYLYLGVLFYVWSNKNDIDRIISMSSPGTNLYLMLCFPRNIRTEFFVQDVFPDGKLWATGLYRFNIIHRWFSRFCYKRITTLFAISDDISRYLQDVYGVCSVVEYNETTMSTAVIDEIRMRSLENRGVSPNRRVLFSGNFSNSHGYERAMGVFEALVAMGVDLRISGFGRNYEKAYASKRLPPQCFGSSMGEAEYRQALIDADIFVVLQGDGYQNFCYSSKYTSLKPLGKKFIYVGPKCAMSEEIANSGTGVCIHGDETATELRLRLETLLG